MINAKMVSINNLKGENKYNYIELYEDEVKIGYTSQMTKEECIRLVAIINHNRGIISRV